MKTDRRVVGLALVSLTISALVVFSFAKEAYDQPVEIIRNQFPTAGGTAYTFALVARKDIENLEVRFAILSKEELRDEEMVDPEMEFGPGSRPEDILANVRRLIWFKERMEAQGILPEGCSGSVRVGNSDYDLVCFDYGRILDHLLGTNETLNLPTIHGALVNSTGHHYYMEGKSRFTTGAIKSLAVSHNEMKVTYVPDAEAEEGSEGVPLSEGPRGVLYHQSLHKDDTVSLVIAIEPFAGFEVRIISIYADGKLCGEPIIDVMK